MNKTIKIKQKNKTKKNKTMKQVHYTGIGCNKSHIHSKKEFLKLAKKQFNECTSTKCKKNKACIKRRTLYKKMLKNNNIIINDYLKEVKECDKCKKKYKCNFEDYLKYSGAIYK